MKTVFVEEAARLLGVSRRTVYNRIHDGRLRTVRTLCGTQRVLLESIETLLREELQRMQQRRRASVDGSIRTHDANELGVASDDPG